MLNRRFTAPFASLALAGALVISLTGCSGKPENSPVVQKKFAEIDEMKETVEDNAQILRTLTGELTIIKDDLAGLRAADPNSQAGQELMSRIDDLELRLGAVGNGTETKIADLYNDKTPTANLQGLATTRTLAEATAEKKTSPPTRTSPSNDRIFPEGTELREKRTTTPPKTTAAPAAPKPAAPKPAATRGRYYTLQSGESLESVAQQNNITVAELMKQNRLPSGATLLKGQRIYIPGN